MNTFQTIFMLTLLAAILYFSPIHLGNKIDGGMGLYSIQEVALYLPVSLLGIFGTWGLNGMLCKSVNMKYFSFAGKNSFGILTWHLLAMVIVMNLLHIAGVDNLPAYKFPLSVTEYSAIIIVGTILITVLFIKAEQKLNLLLKRNH